MLKVSTTINALVDIPNSEISYRLKFVLNAPSIMIADLQMWQDVYRMLNAKMTLAELEYL